MSVWKIKWSEEQKLCLLTEKSWYAFSGVNKKTTFSGVGSEFKKKTLLFRKKIT